MEVYIEYAFLQNFIFDGVLLFLALKGARAEICWKRICLSATVGAVFALIFPVLKCGKTLSLLLKISTAFLICLIPSKLNTKKHRGRYAITVLFFFIFTFALGGAFLGLGKNFSTKYPLFFGLLLFAVCVLLFIEKIYQKRTVVRFLYPCTLFYGEKTVKCEGFLDSGNLAVENDLPVCFLSPDLFYDLIGESYFQGGGQVCDETWVRTVNGGRQVFLYRGEISLEKSGKDIKKQAYFALSKNSISKEYRLLLNARLFD